MLTVKYQRLTKLLTIGLIIMAQIKWNNVDALTSTYGVQSAIQNVQRNLSALGEVATNYIDNRHKENYLANQRVKEANTQAYINQLNQVNTPDEYANFMTQGGGNLSALNNWTNGNIDYGSVNKALGSWSQDAYQRQSYRDSAKDFTPENQQLMNQYYQAIAVGNVDVARAALAKGNFSQKTLSNLGSGMYDVLNSERKFNMEDNKYRLDLQGRMVDLQGKITDQQKYINGLWNSPEIKTRIYASGITDEMLANMSEKEKAELMLSQPEFQEALTTQNQLQDLYNRYSETAQGYLDGTVPPYAAQYQQEYSGGKGKLPQEYLNKVYSVGKQKGLSDAQIRAILGNVHAENGFNKKHVFGSHTDSANGKTNIGMLSWQGGREQGLLRKLGERGQLDERGRIIDNADSFVTQFEYVLDEMVGSESERAQRFLNSKSDDPVQLAHLLDRDFVRSAAHKNSSIRNQRDQSYRQVAGMQFNDLSQNTSGLSVPYAREVINAQNSPNSSVEPVSQQGNTNPQVNADTARRTLNIKDFTNEDGTINVKGIIDRTVQNTNVNQQVTANQEQAKRNYARNMDANQTTEQNDTYAGILSKIIPDYQAKVQNPKLADMAAKNYNMQGVLGQAFGNATFVNTLGEQLKNYDKISSQLAAEMTAKDFSSQLGDLVSTLPDKIFDMPNTLEKTDPVTGNKKQVTSKELYDEIAPNGQWDDKKATTFYDKYFTQGEEWWDKQTMRDDVLSYIRETKDPLSAIHLKDVYTKRQYEVDLARYGKDKADEMRGDLNYTDYAGIYDIDQTQGTYFKQALTSMKHLRKGDIQNMVQRKKQYEAQFRALNNPTGQFRLASHLAQTTDLSEHATVNEEQVREFLLQQIGRNPSDTEATQKRANQARQIMDKVRGRFENLYPYYSEGSDVFPVNDKKKDTSVKPKEIEYLANNADLLSPSEREELSKLMLALGSKFKASK
mgnify:CR=1 FL=1